MSEGTTPIVHVTPREQGSAPDTPATRPPPCSIVIFGATGDLTHRKLIPALYNLFSGWQLPDRVAIVGVGRRGTKEEFIVGLRDAAEKFLGKGFKPAIWDRFAQALDYVKI